MFPLHVLHNYSAISHIAMMVLLTYPSSGLQPTNAGYKLQLLEQSGLAETLVLSMAVLEDQPEVKLQVLQTLQILSSSSGERLLLFSPASGQ